jgi:alkylation response protein AidB-like acyl-CoA dehydrogenase
MPVEFTHSWKDEEVERFRESWVRFVGSKMQPQDAEARKRGHVGHELWRCAGELGFLCVDIPEEWAALAVTFGIRRYFRAPNLRFYPLVLPSAWRQVPMRRAFLAQ